MTKESLRFDKLLAESTVIQRWQCRQPSTGELLHAFVLKEQTQLELEYFQRHVYLNSQLSSGFVPRLHSYRIDVASMLNGSVQLVTDYCESIPLDDWLRVQPMPPTRSDLARLVMQISQGVAELHRLGYVHRRLHSGHIHIDSIGQPVLYGLGRCQPIGVRVGNSAQHDCLPLNRWSRYVAPEVSSCRELCASQDIYSLGILFADLLGHSFLQSNLGRCMTAQNPAVRPTASELGALFYELHQTIPAAA